MKRIQIFNIDALNYCEDCRYGTISDLYHEPMCNNPVDTHILYPEFKGENHCPLFEHASEE